MNGAATVKNRHVGYHQVYDLFAQSIDMIENKNYGIGDYRSHTS